LSKADIAPKPSSPQARNRLLESQARDLGKIFFFAECGFIRQKV
jgi:hypothetical protein